MRHGDIRNRRSVQLLTALGAVLALLMTACGGAAQTGGAQKTIRIGMVLPNLSIKAIADLADGAKARAKQLGNVEVNAFGSNDMAQEVAKVENFISQKVDVIVIDALDSTPMIPALKEAATAKIPVVLIVTDVQGEKKSLLVADELNGGVQVGQYIAKRLNQQGNVGLIAGSGDDYTEQLRLKGYDQAAASSPGLKTVAKLNGNWDRPTALSVANNLLTAHPDVNALFALNDDMAFGVASAVQARGKKLVLVGYNGAADGIQAVWNGTFDATVMLRLYGVGQKAVDVAVAVAKGQSVEAKTVTTPLLVDKAMIQGFLDGTQKADPDVIAFIKTALGK
jgi:ABC-type sugar transport system substrate-binding protein